MNIQLSDHFTYTRLLRFTLPTIIMMIFTSIYGVVDGLFVSNIVGSDAFAAVNLVMPILFILGSVGFLFGTGGSALVAKTLGEGNRSLANRYFSMLIYLVIGVGIVMTIAGLFSLRPLVERMGASEEIEQDCIVYGSVLFLGLIGFFLQNCFQSFLVVAEKPRMGLVLSLIVGGTNMVLDFFFIYVCSLGVLGAALATGISQLVGGVVPFVYFLRPNPSPLQLIRTKLEWRPIGKACVNGSSEMMTNISLSLVNMLYNLQLMRMSGTNGVVAYGIIMYVGFIFISTYLGYSIGSAPIISYHYGADNRKELHSLFGKSICIVAVTSIGLTALAELLAMPFSAIFIGYDPTLLELSTKALQIYSFSFLLSGINIFSSGFFTALNNGVFSAILSFLRTLFFQVIAVLVVPLFLGANGIWSAILFAEAGAFCVSVGFLFCNRKRYHYAGRR